MKAITDSQKLALDTILQKPVRGIGIWCVNLMEWRMIDKFAGEPEGSYAKDPVPVYRKMQENAAVCMIDQWIPKNPLTMGAQGYENNTQRKATTGAEIVTLDGINIVEPEDVVEHLEKFEFPKLESKIQDLTDASSLKFDEIVQSILRKETERQTEVGPEILKVPYGYVSFPRWRYGLYGYGPYFMAYALYPEVMEKDFKLQADYAELYNKATARAYEKLPPMARLDSDMADGRGTIVGIQTIDKIWFPHFARAIKPMLNTGVKMIWHCDGNLSDMLPRLIDCGLSGFQGFQYEHGMDYEKICKMKTLNGDDLLIIGGVSVTRTLPHGTPDDVKKEMDWLVENGPKQGLFLGCSSSVAPGVPRENLDVMVKGFHYYREHGRR